MKPYHLRRPPWRDIRNNKAVYVPELPATGLLDWTYIVNGKHWTWVELTTDKGVIAQWLPVNPAWTFATHAIYFINHKGAYDIISTR